MTCLSRSISLIYLHACVCVYWCRQHVSPIWAAHTHTHTHSIRPHCHFHSLTRSLALLSADLDVVIKLYTILGAHRRRPNMPAGRPACRLNCSLRLSASLYLSLRPRVSLSTVRLASCSGHTFNQFTLKHQQLHYVTRRRLYVPSSLVHCVVRGEVLPFTRSLASAVPYSRSLHDRVAFLLSRGNFEFQRETLKNKF